MSPMPFLAFFSLFLAFASEASPSSAQVVESSTGTRFEARTQVGGKSYRCLGAGVRKVLFFKAYAAAFCLEEQRFESVVGSYLEQKHGEKSGQELAKALEGDLDFFAHLGGARANKLVIMQLVRDISRERIAKAFSSSLGEVLPEESVAKLIETIPGDGEKGQRILLYSQGPVLVIDIDGEAKQVEDELITRTLWRVWLGPESVTPAIRGSIAHTLAR